VLSVVPVEFELFPDMVVSVVEVVWSPLAADTSEWRVKASSATELTMQADINRVFFFIVEFF
jgi:hypothetical protein